MAWSLPSQSTQCLMASLPQYPSRGCWEYGIQLVVSNLASRLGKEQVQRGQEAHRSVQETLNICRFIHRGAVPSNNLEFSGQVSVLHGEQEEKGADCHSTQKAGVTLDLLSPCLGRSSQQERGLMLYLPQALGSSSSPHL